MTDATPHATITRTVEETQTYERTVPGLELVVAKGETSAVALTVRASCRFRTPKDDTWGSRDGEVVIRLNLERRRKDGERSYRGDRQVEIGPKYRSRLERIFTPETIERLDALHEEILAEFTSIDWTKQ